MHLDDKVSIQGAQGNTLRISFAVNDAEDDHA